MIDVYQRITETIIRQLEAGVVPWHKPWSGGEARAPQNLVSRKHYRGINPFLLSCTPFEQPYWLTYKQAQALGGHVRRGERSTPVVFWKWLAKEDHDGKEKRIPLLRHYCVFNVAQCDLPAGKVPTLPETVTNDVQPIEACERVVAAMPNAPAIHHDSNGAFYRPAADAVHMPKRERFESAELYYGTLFHELTHATGHPSRLNREGITGDIRFGSRTYSREELVAEMGSAFLCGHTGIENQTLDNSASYIAGWLAKLQNDKRLVVTAAAQAQRAADFILGRRFDEGQADE